MVKIKRIAWILAALPLIDLLLEFFLGSLGANPIQAITRSLGDWAFRFLLLTLAITPLRMLTRWGRISVLRRSFGLIAFTYACLHLLSYVGLDQFFDWPVLWKDIVKRQYITIGMIAFVMLLALAITSANPIMKRMGAVRWKALHRIIYIIPLLVTVHFWMMIRAGYDRPTLYGFVAIGLLAMRVVRVTMRPVTDESSS